MYLDVSGEIQTQRSGVEGKGLMTRPTWSRKVGKPRKVRGARACTGLGLRPAPLRREREGRRGGGCLPERCGERPRVTLTWRQLRECSHPGPGSPHARTGPDPGLRLQPVPATLLPFSNPEPGILPSPPPPGAPRKLPSAGCFLHVKHFMSVFLFTLYQYSIKLEKNYSSHFTDEELGFGVVEELA